MNKANGGERGSCRELFLRCNTLDLALIYSNLFTLTGGMLRNVCSLEIKPVFIHIGYRLKMDLLVLLYQKLLTDFIHLI